MLQHTTSASRLSFSLQKPDTLQTVSIKRTGVLASTATPTATQLESLPMPTCVPHCAVEPWYLLLCLCCRLYDAHVAAAAGRSISFHHISKTGGTSLCSVAWDNGCRGPGMSKKDNCLLDIG